MTRCRNVGLPAVLAAIWGSAFVVIKAKLKFSPSVLFAVLRYDVAEVVMLAYALYVTDLPLPRGKAEWTEVAIGAVLLIAVYHAPLLIGEIDPIVTSAAAAVIASLSPVPTTGFVRLLLSNEQFTSLDIVGLLPGLAGVAVPLGLDSSNLLAGGMVAKLLIFDAAMAFAFGSVLIRWVDSELPIETMEAWSMLLGAGLMHVVSVGLGERPEVVVPNVQLVTALAYLSPAVSALGFFIYFDLLVRLGPTEINLAPYVTPVFAVFSG